MYIKRIKIHDLENLLRSTRIIGKGHFSRVLYLNDRELLKVTKKFFKGINPSYGQNPMSIEELKRKNFYFNPDLNQLKYYSLIQNNIKLTKLPTGLAVCEDIPCGLILPNHRNYSNLSSLTHVSKLEMEKSNKSYFDLYLEKTTKLYPLLYNLLLEMRELEINNISQEDLTYNYQESQDFNVLVKDLEPQIIDLDGSFVKYGNNFINANDMYIEFGELINILDELFHLDLIFNSKNIIDFYSSINLLEEFKNRMLIKKLIK